MIRASGGNSMELFESGVVAIGFGTAVDLSNLNRDGISKAYSDAHPEASIYKAGGAIGMLHRFASKMKQGDRVVSYDPSTRVYYVGKIVSDYYFQEDESGRSHRRKVDWEDRRISRDDLKPATRNSLGSTLTVFLLNEDTVRDIERVLSGTIAEPTAEDEQEDIEEDKQNLRENARERVKDRIVALDDREMEDLLAALFRAMGFKATVSPVGPDRGVDVIASPDGLGLQDPRIKAEVKHQKNSRMGPQDIRNFIGALRASDRGVYLSTGGFTKEARYEAERANVPVTLLDLDGLARLIEGHYDNFDTDGRMLLPLTRVLWPAD